MEISEVNSKTIFPLFLKSMENTFLEENSILPYVGRMLEKFSVRKVMNLLEDLKSSEEKFAPVYNYFIGTINAIANSKKRPGISEMEFEDLVSVGAFALWEFWKGFYDAAEENPTGKEAKEIELHGDSFYKEPYFISMFKTSYQNKIKDIARSLDKKKPFYHGERKVLSREELERSLDDYLKRIKSKYKKFKDSGALDVKKILSKKELEDKDKSIENLTKEVFDELSKVVIDPDADYLKFKASVSDEDINDLNISDDLKSMLTQHRTYSPSSLDAPLGFDSDGGTLGDLVASPEDDEVFNEKGFYSYILRWLKDPVAWDIIAELDDPGPEMKKQIAQKEGFYDENDFYKFNRAQLVRSLDFPDLPIDTDNETINYTNLRKRENRVNKAWSEIVSVGMALAKDQKIRDRFNIPDRYFRSIKSNKA